MLSDASRVRPYSAGPRARFDVSAYLRQGFRRHLAGLHLFPWNAQDAMSSHRVAIAGLAVAAAAAVAVLLLARATADPGYPAQLTRDHRASDDRHLILTALIGPADTVLGPLVREGAQAVTVEVRIHLYSFIAPDALDRDAWRAHRAPRGDRELLGPSARPLTYADMDIYLGHGTSRHDL